MILLNILAESAVVDALKGRNKSLNAWKAAFNCGSGLGYTVGLDIPKSVLKADKVKVLLKGLSCILLKVTRKVGGGKTYVF